VEGAGLEGALEGSLPTNRGLAKTAETIVYGCPVSHNAPV